MRTGERGTGITGNGNGGIQGAQDVCRQAGRQAGRQVGRESDKKLKKSGCAIGIDTPPPRKKSVSVWCSFA